MLDSATVWTKAFRAVQALRLAAPGSISIGPMWFVRPARFNFGVGGLRQYGFSIPSIGPQYVWSDKIGTLFPKIYQELAQLEREGQKGYDRSPGNLVVALRAFMATYDRWPWGADSQLLDCITTLEALLGTETEVTFKLSFRVAALLAHNESQRAELLRLMKDFYDTRSKLVHGAKLKAKHQLRLEQVEDLRSLVRRVLRSFVAFAANPPTAYNKSFFQEQLDEALVNATEREKLRATLGLNLE